MTKYFPLRKFQFISLIIFFIISCGGDDIVEDIVEIYESGNKKIIAHFHPDVNVIEKQFFTESGELFHLEQDSLSYTDDFQKFIIGTWIMDKMIIDGEIVFEIERNISTIMFTEIAGYPELIVSDTLAAIELLNIQKNVLIKHHLNYIL